MIGSEHSFGPECERPPAQLVGSTTGAVLPLPTTESLVIDLVRKEVLWLDSGLARGGDLHVSEVLLKTHKEKRVRFKTVPAAENGQAPITPFVRRFIAVD